MEAQERRGRVKGGILNAASPSACSDGRPGVVVRGVRLTLAWAPVFVFRWVREGVVGLVDTPSLDAASGLDFSRADSGLPPTLYCCYDRDSSELAGGYSVGAVPLWMMVQVWTMN